MDRIEVDPKLFITCRLCLDEMGQYQIQPKMQKQIMYCFDIAVEPFDGLPQLLCKKCESILNQYDEIKKKFQEKQDRLKAKNLTNTCMQQQQDTVSSTQQVDSECIAKSSKKETKSLLDSSLSTEEWSSRKSDSSFNISHKTKNKLQVTTDSQLKDNYKKQYVCRFCSKTFKVKKGVVRHVKYCDVIKKYSGIVRNCNVSLNKTDLSDNFTLKRENVVYSRNKIINCKNSKYNIIYRPKTPENILNSDSTDEDFNITKKKHKRPRLLSKSSTDTLIIDNGTSNDFTLNAEEDEDRSEKNDPTLANEISNRIDIDLVSIDDSDSASTTSNQNIQLQSTNIESESKAEVVNDKVLHNIITMCYNKYLKRCEADSRNSKDTGNERGSFLQRKVLSLGRKIIHNRGGLNSMGLLRYMEYKNLDVEWIPKLHINVIIKTKLKEHYTDDDKIETNNVNWKNLKDVDPSYIQQDFVDIFEELSESENISINNINIIPNKTTFLSQVQRENIIDVDSNQAEDVRPKNVMDNFLTLIPSQNVQIMVPDSFLLVPNTPESKILNANPVANPKQLPSKKLFSLLTSNNSSPPCTDVQPISDSVNDDSEDQHAMPIITSTMSLASMTNGKEISEGIGNNTQIPESQIDKSKTQTFPRIKVKPVSELMPENSLSQQSSPISSLKVWAYNPPYKSVATDLPISNPPPAYTKIAPKINNFSSLQYGTDSIANIAMTSNISYAHSLQNTTTSIPHKSSNNSQVVLMHTFELPNTKTSSPFKYFQQLLQMHNIVLIECTDPVNMICLIKFKLMFQQENLPAVTLCLSLYTDKINRFCIIVKDAGSQPNQIIISSLSANWQWEIIKELKGNVVTKLLDNAKKSSPDVYLRTTKFVNLLDTIKFSKNTHVFFANLK